MYLKRPQALWLCCCKNWKKDPSVSVLPEIQSGNVQNLCSALLENGKPWGQTPHCQPALGFWPNGKSI